MSCCHGAATAASVDIKAWFEYWQIECAQCRIPFESAVRPNLRRCNLAREDPQWFSRLLPAAKAGGARLADFAKQPQDVALTPGAVLNLMSMRLDVAPFASNLAGYRPHLGWDISHYIAELFVPGLRERTSPDLIPQTWTADTPVRAGWQMNPGRGAELIHGGARLQKDHGLSSITGLADQPMAGNSDGRKSPFKESSSS